MKLNQENNNTEYSILFHHSERIHYKLYKSFVFKKICASQTCFGSAFIIPRITPLPGIEPGSAGPQPAILIHYTTGAPYWG